MSYLNEVVCLECGYSMTGDMNITSCDRCHSQWVDARYDYEAVAGIWATSLKQRPASLWRYAELLPTEMNPEIPMGEGFTPLIRLYQYQRIFNHYQLYIKDERQNPAASFKDRQAVMAVTAMKQAGIKECVLASTGNAGVAYAAYCARAGIKLWLFLTSLVPAEKLREAALYGTEVVKVSGTYDETKKIAAEFAQRKGIHLDGGAKAIPGKESMKTIAYEIAEQLGLAMNAQGSFVSPDWYIQAVSGGIGPLGVWKGFTELLRMGLIDKMPRLGIVQAAGCAPMVEALAAGKEKADPVVPKTLIAVLATGDPGFSYVQLREAVLSNDGAMIAIEDGDTFAAMRRLAESEGISVEPATGVAIAGLERMLTDGMIAPHETVVLNCSGHTFPVESHVLGDQYYLNLQLDQSKEQLAPRRTEAGLTAAFEDLDEQITTILLVDDNLSDRRLIRRLLQHHKRYRIFEAQTGTSALKMIEDRKPDLIVCDLTMPDMDGFTLMEKLRSNPATSDIPIIVVSAKTLSARDREILAAQTTSFWMKGGFDTYKLVENVTRTLGDEPPPPPIRSASRSRSLPVAAGIDESAGKPTIVLIDSDAEDMRLTQRYIQSTGRYRVISAATGRDGLRAIYTHHPDLIVLELTLSDMKGTEVLETLKAKQELREIPIVIVSSETLSEGEREDFGTQIHEFFSKHSLDKKSFTYAISGILM